MAYIDIVLDGPPGETAGRFVEVDDENGRSFTAGEWIKRADGFWVLRIHDEKTRDEAARAGRRKQLERIRLNAGELYTVEGCHRVIVELLDFLLEADNG